MLLLSLLKTHWFELIQTIGIVAGFIYTARSFSLDSRSRRAEFAFSVNSAHRDIWSELLRNPSLARVLELAPDLASKSITEEEEHFVVLILIHLASVHHAIGLSVYPHSPNLDDDVRRFFSLPIPSNVLERYLALQAPAFREYLKRILAAEPIETPTSA